MGGLLTIGLILGFVGALVGVGVALLFAARAQQPPPPAMYHCPSCQALIARDAQACPKCGRHFD